MMTRPYRPPTNGKSERFIRTMLHEWAYAKLYVTNQERLDALPVWLDFYNGRRSHTALGSLPPNQWVVKQGEWELQLGASFPRVHNLSQNKTFVPSFIGRVQVQGFSKTLQYLSRSMH